jgi:hypothetical protein
VATQLWFDEHLKGTFAWPETPTTKLTLNTGNGIPSLTVQPDVSKKILSVDVYCTQQGEEPAPDRFWYHVSPTKSGTRWTAAVPVLSTDKPLWVYANVLYALDEPVTGAGYYYRTYTTDEFNLSSLLSMVSSEQLKQAGVKATLKPARVIEDFAKDWQKEWFTYSNDPNDWARSTRKVSDARYQAPAFAKLAFEVRSEKPGKLVLAVDDAGAEIELKGGPDWQQVILYPTGLDGVTGGTRLDWKGLKELSLCPWKRISSREAEKPLLLGAKDWQGAAPEFRNMRWVPGTREELNQHRKVRLAEVKPVDGRIYLDVHDADVFKSDLRTRTNKSFGGQPLAIGDKTYKRGIGTHANSSGLFYLKGLYKRFHAEVGVQKGQPGSVRFHVFVDDKEAFSSGMMRKDEGPKTVDVDLTGAMELRLVVDDGGNGKGCDHANWADAWVTAR